MAFVSSPAMAADQMSVGVGGYMQQWIGYADRDDDGQDGGWDAQSDSEVHIKGSLESDMGLKYTVHIELEGNQNADGASEIDESFVRVSGEFGQIEMGARDHALVRMHYGVKDVGVGLNAGDTQKWVPGTYLETNGHAYSGGDDVKLNYISPRMNGIQVGLSYAPDQANENAVTTAPNGNDNASWGAAVNFAQPFGDGTVSLSLGHQSIGTTAQELKYISGMLPTGVAAGETGDHRITAGKLVADKKLVAQYQANSDLMLYDKQKALPTAPTGGDALATAYADAVDAQNAILNATDGALTKGGDDATYTNFGVGVGFGAFSFNVAYATMSADAYTVKRKNMVLDANNRTTRAAAGNLQLLQQAKSFQSSDGTLTGTITDRSADTGTALSAEGSGAFTGAQIHIYDTGKKNADGSAIYAIESATMNDPNNDLVQETVVEDGSKDFDVWGASVTYTDGPMAVSLAHMTHEADDGGERNATMVSGSYSLAPGVDWKTSVFGVEDTTGHKDVTGGLNEGTGFVTGITLSF